MSLKESKCEACTIDAPLATENQKKEFMSDIDGWQIDNKAGIEQLCKTFNFKNYFDGLGFLKAVAEMAEENDHHPKLVLEWGKVEVRWWSHKIQGLHKNDFICCFKNDEIFKVF